MLNSLLGKLSILDPFESSTHSCCFFYFPTQLSSNFYNKNILVGIDMWVLFRNYWNGSITIIDYCFIKIKGCQ